ncbi:ABC transporter substrate-binding protein [uncultured Clostridium sp.]|uniref:ABC transporter substrate-binding protein n=1 Tax=uncultured Clostridium sp. TaxID=59620 RepID=UPI0025FA0DD2|nr:ABC transporter substrate-binding protein [uncultured Clostridium sp.]
MKKILKKFTTGLLLVIFVLSMAGCGEIKNSQNNSSVNLNSTESSETVYPLNIKDSFGNMVTIEKEPEKIISAAPNITELIFDLGSQDKLIGRTDYCDYPEETKNIESIGTIMSPDIEKIISLEPDILIASTHFNQENAQKLEEAGIKVVSLYEKDDVDGVYTMIETMGMILNKNKESENCISEMKKTINDVQNAVKDLEYPTVYYVVGYGEGGDFSAPENSFIGGLINLAGGKDIVPSSDSWSFSLESLIEADPYIIVIGKGQKEDFMSKEGYNELTAVKEGRVYEIDNNLIDRQGYRNKDGVLELAKIFHPEAFK